jgi:SM-20-related protein
LVDLERYQPLFTGCWPSFTPSRTPARRRGVTPLTTVPTGFSQIAEDLATTGWSVSPGFLDELAIDALIETEKRLWEDEAFRQAGIGAGGQHAVRPEIRSDRILWLDDADLPEAVRPYRARIDALSAALNETLYLGLRGFEAHFAVYPPGACYRPHLDQFKTVQHRMISCLLYLNRGWAQEDGGQLRIYPPDAPNNVYVDVWPEAGTFVCFRSDRIVHEVLPARRHRFSLTGWLHRERAF